MFSRPFAKQNLGRCHCSEALYESDELSQEGRDLAALLASKVYYFLGDYEEALSFALGAGPAFQAERTVPGSDEYIDTVIGTSLCFATFRSGSCNILARAVDRYVEARAEEEGVIQVDPRLQVIIENVFKRCIDFGEYKQVNSIIL